MLTRMDFHEWAMGVKIPLTSTLPRQDGVTLPNIQEFCYLPPLTGGARRGWHWANLFGFHYRPGFQVLSASQIRPSRRN